MNVSLNPSFPAKAVYRQHTTTQVYTPPTTTQVYTQHTTAPVYTPHTTPLGHTQHIPSVQNLSQNPPNLPPPLFVQPPRLVSHNTQYTTYISNDTQYFLPLDDLMELIKKDSKVNTPGMGSFTGEPVPGPKQTQDTTQEPTSIQEDTGELMSTDTHTNTAGSLADLVTVWVLGQPGTSTGKGKCGGKGKAKGSSKGFKMENTSEQSEDPNSESRDRPVEGMIVSPRPEVITIQDSPIVRELNTPSPIGSPHYSPPSYHYSPYYPEVVDITSP